MNKIAIQLLKKMAGIDVDQLQSEFNRVQGENVKVTIQLKYALQDLANMEKRMARLTDEIALLKAGATADTSKPDTEDVRPNSFSEAIHRQLIDAEATIVRLNEEVDNWRNKYTLLKETLEKQTTLLNETQALLSEPEETTATTDETSAEQELVNETESPNQELPDEEKGIVLTDEMLQKIVDDMNDVRYDDLPKMPQNVALVQYLKGKLIELNEQVANMEKEKNELPEPNMPTATVVSESMIPANGPTVGPIADIVEEVITTDEAAPIAVSEEPQATESMPEQTEATNEVAEDDGQAPAITDFVVESPAEESFVVVETEVSIPMQANVEEAVPNEEILFTTETMPQEETDSVDAEMEVSEASVDEAEKETTFFIDSTEIEQLEKEAEEHAKVEMELKLDEPLFDTIPPSMQPASTETDDAPTVSQEEVEPAAPSTETIQSEIHPELCTPESLQDELTELTRHFAYVRISTTDNGQFLFEAKQLQVMQQLFEWGLEGIDMVSGDNRFLPHENIIHLQGLRSPFIGKEVLCHFDDDADNNSEEVTQILLLAMCGYHPLRIRYRGKNGVVATTNLFYFCEEPSTAKFKLPYPKMFERMLTDQPDLSNIAALTSQHNEAKTFQLQQLISVEIYDVFYTTAEGIKWLQNGIKSAHKAGLDELERLLTYSVPKWYKQ